MELVLSAFYGQARVPETRFLNIIARQYAPQDSIGYHIDRAYFREPVFVVVLQNMRPGGVRQRRMSGALAA